MVCGNCGNALQADAKFCTVCGAPVSSDSPGSAEPTTPVPPPPAVPPSAAPATGPVPPSSPVDAASSSYPSAYDAPAGVGSGGRSRLLLVAAVAIVFVVALAVVALVVVGGDDDGKAGAAKGNFLDFPNGQVAPVYGSGPASAPKKQWTTKLDCNAQCELETNGDLVFTAEEDHGKHRLEAFSADTGKSVWKNTKVKPGDFGVSLDLYDDMILMATETDDGSVVTAFDQATGKQLWSTIGNFDGFVSGDLLLLTRATSVDEATVVAVGAGDGEEVWKADGRIVGVCAGKAVLGRDRQVAVVDVDSGERAWTTRVLAADKTTCAGNRVYALTSGGVTAFDIGSGNRAWRASVSGADAVGAVDDLAIVLGSKDITAFEGNGGKKRWSRAVDKEKDPSSGFVLPVSGGKVIGFSDDNATLLSLDDGSLGKGVPNTDVGTASKDQIYFRREDERNIHAVDMDTLTEQWKADIGKYVDKVVAGGGRLFVLHDDSITAYG